MNTFVKMQVYSREKDPDALKPNYIMAKSYMKIKSVLSYAILLILLFSAGKASAQNCSIVTSSPEGCVGSAVIFSATGSATNGADSIVFDLAGTKSRSNPTSFTFNTLGAKAITLTVYKNGQACTANLSFTVNPLPSAEFVLGPGYQFTQCYTSNEFCFTDQSQPGSTGNPLTKRTILFGDGGGDTASAPNSQFCYSYLNPAGGCYNVFLEVTDNKGCVSNKTRSQYICVKQDLAVSFITNTPRRCDSTKVPFLQASAIPFDSVAQFIWIWGDTSRTERYNPADFNKWQNAERTYYLNGCFDATLIVQNKFGCWDTFTKKDAACNTKITFDINVANGDVQCAGNQAFIFANPAIPGATFQWDFDDPPSGNENTEDQEWTKPHAFTGVGPFNVKLDVKLNGCLRDTIYKIYVKGPGASIESKAVPDIIHDTMRHQCQIKDTVFFPNNSGFFWNDKNPINDTAKTAAGRIHKPKLSYSVFRPNPVTPAFIAAIIDTLFLNNQGRTTPFVNQYADTAYIVDAPPAPNWVIHDTLILYNNYGGSVIGDRRADHVVMVWDFADQFAPQCTTWSKYNQNTYDYTRPIVLANGKTSYPWINCNFSRDPLPKHWYTPGREQCYTVVLRMKDTTFASVLDTIKLITFGDTMGYFYDSVRFGADSIPDPKHPGKKMVNWNKWINPNVSNNKACESQSTVSLALMPPNAAGLRWSGIACYGPAPPYGITFNWAQTRPGCTQQFVWLHLDSAIDRKDATPNVFDQWRPQDALLLAPAPGTPWPMGTLGMPSWPTSSFFNYPVGSLADSCGYITVGFRVQNGKDPNTGQPCIDEKWYHNFLRYTPNDSRFSVTPRFGCRPLDVEVTLQSEVQDSIISMTFTYANTDPAKLDDVFSEVDSVFRRKYDPRTGDTINYVITYNVFADGSSKKVDSVAFIPGVGGQVGCGTEVKFKKKRYYTFKQDGRYAVIVTATNTDGCSSPRSSIVIAGFFKEVNSSKQVICKNENVEFYDSARYFLEEPDPLTGDILLQHDFWKRPKRDQYPDNTPRTAPVGGFEAVRWDFGQGQGFVNFLGTPTPFPKIVSYPLPGYYKIRVEFKDSVGCKDTLEIPLNVTGVSANFGFSTTVGNICKPIVTFFDSSLMYDPCFVRQGVKCDSIVRRFWNFGDPTSGTDNTSILKDPLHRYTEFGDFDVTLVVETSLGCFDTIVRTVSIEGPRPRFEFAVDSVGCAPFTVYLRNLSIDPPPGAIWTWNFGDNTVLTTDQDTNVTHTYSASGVYSITLGQLSGIPLVPGLSCQDTFPKAPRVIQVRVLPERKVDFVADRKIVCPGDVITFTDSSDAIYKTFKWDFADGTVSTLDSIAGKKVTHAYANPGTYVVRLTPTYIPVPGDPSCPTTKSMQIIVRTVDADFDIDSSRGAPIFAFTNKSTNGQNYWWKFGDGDDFTPCPQVDPNNCPNALHDYKDNIGTFTVCLIAQSPEGCYDTMCKEVVNTFKTIFKPYNVFTPDGDGVNDKFVIEVEGWLEYEIVIYNRWGEKVFESTDPTKPWDGTNKDTGKPCPDGTYYVVIKYKLRGQTTTNEYNGTVKLIRE